MGRPLGSRNVLTLKAFIRRAQAAQRAVDKILAKERREQAVLAQAKATITERVPGTGRGQHRSPAPGGWRARAGETTKPAEPVFAQCVLPSAVLARIQEAPPAFENDEYFGDNELYRTSRWRKWSLEELLDSQTDKQETTRPTRYPVTSLRQYTENV